MPNSTPRRVDLTQKVPVRIQSLFNVGKGALMNVSSTGAYVATPMYLLPQGRVKLQIVLREERRWVEAEAVVVWENRGTVGRRDDLPPGYGLRFVVVPKDTEAVLDNLLTGNGRVPSSAPPMPVPARRPAPADTLAPAAPRPPEPVVASFDSEPDGPPYRLRGDHVDKNTPESQPGIFVLSYDRTQEARVGRADTDLRSTIASFEGEYAYFYCEAIDDVDERFARECELFHRLGGDRGQLDNTDHPQAPPATDVACPVCMHESARRP